MVILMAQPHPKPGQVVDLRPLRSKLRDAKTTELVKEEHFEAISPDRAWAQRLLCTMLQGTSCCIVLKARLFSGWPRRKPRRFD